MRKISNIEVVEELIYQDEKVLGKRNLFEGQKIEMVKKNEEIEHEDKPCHRKHIGKEWCFQSRYMKLTSDIDMKGEEIDKLQKAENTAIVMRRILKTAAKQEER